MTPPWLPRFRRQLARLRGEGVVVAVSGGGDSVGLLRALAGVGAEFGLRLSVAHLDHGTRGEEGRGDARFVAELAASMALDFDLGHWQAHRAGHFEADARAARYDWLVRIARGRNARFVAVGQTLDDQAETVLHRVVRGTGLRGLAGMPGRRRLVPGVTLVRPLLEVTRAEVRAYLDAIGQGFREDSTNRDTSRTRARIRQELLPEIARSYNPNVAEALVRLAGIAAEANRVVDRLARRRLATILLESRPGSLTFDRPALARLAPADRVEVLRLAWRKAGWPEQGMDARAWQRLARLDSGSASIGSGVEASTTDDRLVLRRQAKIADVPRPDPVPLPVPGWAAWPGGRIGTSLDLEEIVDESVDRDCLAFPLFVRVPEPGDRFDPLGLDGRTQPLSDFFRGRRVPRPLRGSIPLVCDQSGIVWVVGQRIAHRVRRTPATARTVGLRFEVGSAPRDA